MGRVKEYLGKWKCGSERKSSIEIGTLKTEKYQELSDVVVEENKTELENFEDNFELTNDIEDLVKNAEDIKEKISGGYFLDKSVKEYIKIRFKEKSELIKEAFGKEYSNLVNIFDDVADYISEDIHSKLSSSRPESPLDLKEKERLETENLYSTNIVN